MAMIWPCGGWTWRWPQTPLGPVPVSGTLRFQLAVPHQRLRFFRIEVMCIGTARCLGFSPPLLRRRPRSDRGRSMGAGPPEIALGHLSGCGTTHLRDRTALLHPPPVPFHRLGLGVHVCSVLQAPSGSQNTHTPPLFARAPGPARAHSRPAPSTVPPKVVSASTGRRTHFHGVGGYILSASVCTPRRPTPSR